MFLGIIKQLPKTKACRTVLLNHIVSNNESMVRSMGYFPSSIQYDIDERPLKQKKYLDEKRQKKEERERIADEYFASDKADTLLTSDEFDLLRQNVKNDLPSSTLPNPYGGDKKRCIICKYNVPLNHKNTRLLSQFVSPYTGDMYGRDITGLCIYMHERVQECIYKARTYGFMPYMMKDPHYLKDSKICGR